MYFELNEYGDAYVLTFRKHPELVKQIQDRVPNTKIRVVSSPNSYCEETDRHIMVRSAKAESSVVGIDTDPDECVSKLVDEICGFLSSEGFEYIYLFRIETHLTRGGGSEEAVMRFEFRYGAI